MPDNYAWSVQDRITECIRGIPADPEAISAHFGVCPATGDVSANTGVA
jgi:hypothetical protein